MDNNLLTFEIKQFFGWLIDYYVDALAENMELRKRLEEANEKIALLTNNK
jgi:hypothetical protein